MLNTLQWPEHENHVTNSLLITSRIYRFPLEPTEGAAQRATAQSWGTWAWKGVVPLQQCLCVLSRLNYLWDRCRV